MLTDSPQSRKQRLPASCVAVFRCSASNFCLRGKKNDVCVVVSEVLSVL